MASFLEKLRAPRLLGDGYDGSETAGESDALSRMASLHELDTLMGGRLGRGGGGGGRMRPMSGGAAGPGRNFNPYGRASGPQGPMNVVYDQRPEQFAKEVKLRERDQDLKAETNQMLNAIKQQDADTRGQRADTYEFGVRNPIGRLVNPRGGNTTVIDPRTGRAIDTGVATGTMTQDDEVAARAAAALAQIGERGSQARETEGVRQEGRVEMAGVQQENNLNRDKTREDLYRGRQPSSSQQSEALRGAGREVFNKNPNWQQWIQFDDDGNFVVVKPDSSGTGQGPDLGTWHQINSALYGPKERSINQNKGSDASGLTGTPGQATTTTFTEGGKTWNIPANRIGDFMKAHPNAQRR